MSTVEAPAPGESAEARCANCGQPLEPTDKFCRECGLPSLRQAARQHAAPADPPDTRELKRALDVEPDPRPFLRPEGADTIPASASEELTTGGVVNVTNPTWAAGMAASTLLMVGLIVFFVGLGVLLLVLAFRP